MNSPEHPHILGHYEQALRELEKQFLAFSQQIFDKVLCTKTIINHPDENTANKLIACSSDMDEEARAITLKAKTTLQQYQPFAGDLRTVISIMRATDRVHEINREVVHIAKAVKKLMPESPAQIPPILITISDMACDELRDAIASFERKDSTLARSIRERDRKLDAEHRRLMEKLITHISEHKYEVSIGLHYIFIVRAIERIGDHAKAIAATSVFQNEGKEIRHPGHPPQSEHKE